MVDISGVVNLGKRTKQACTIRATAVHCLALEVRGERTSPVGTVLESLVAVRTEGTGQYADVAKDTLILAGR